MKKLILIAAVAFTACKGSSSEASKCDTACVKADSIKPIVDTIKKIK